MKPLNRNKIEKTESLEEAIKLIFGINMKGRTKVLPTEEFTPELAATYDSLGLTSRLKTYSHIAVDFMGRVLPQNGLEKSKVILDVGCGSGFLSLALGSKVNATVYGMDSSEIMIRLAERNKRLLWQSNSFDLGSVWFCKLGVYDISQVSEHLTMNSKGPNYEVCRNVLHRLAEPEKALRSMYDILVPGGKIYLRDLRRDAPWKTILERVGEQRWQFPELVKDYLGAMANMFTVGELSDLLYSLGMKHTIMGGAYLGIPDPANTLRSRASGFDDMYEYAKETEFVCVIEK